MMKSFCLTIALLCSFYPGTNAQSGYLDFSFSEDGIFTAGLTTSFDIVYSAALQADGKLLMNGISNGDFAIMRLLADGTPDPEFGTGGVYVISFGSSTDVYGMAVQPDGKILVGGNSNVVMEEERWLLARFHANGSLDEGFGNAGITTTEMPGSNGSVSTVLIQSDSRVVQAGFSGSNPNLDFAAVRYIADFVLTYTVNEISCNGANDGSIIVDASGGVAPYGYSLDGIEFQSENTFTGLVPGSYTIIIKDSNGPGTAATIGPIVITEPVIPAVDVTVVENDITIIVGSGGIKPYQYSIDGGLSYASTSSFTDLTDGAYFIQVLDGKGCLLHYSVVLIDITTTHDPVESVAFTISPNPTTGQVRLEMNNIAAEQLQLSIMDMTGRIIYTTTISETGPVIRKFDLKFLDNGVYQVWVRNETRRGTQRLVIAW